jgi:hypothetical protein
MVSRRPRLSAVSSTRWPLVADNAPACAGVVGAALDGQIRQLQGGAVCIGRGNLDARIRLDAAEEFVLTQEHIGRRQYRAFRVALRHVVAVLYVLPEGVGGTGYVAVQHHQGGFAHVVEQGGGFVEEQRQVVLDAGREQIGRHILIDAALGRVAFHAFAVVLAEGGDAAFVRRIFARRQHADFRHRVQRALAVRVEGAQAVDFLVEQVDAVGQGLPMGNRSTRPPRMENSPGAITWVTWL